jgi:tetratricopeptide (TPR) repeat protein
MRVARHQFTDEDLAIIEHHVQESPASPAWRCMRCWFSAQTGNLAQARGDLALLARDAFAGLPRDANWLSGIFELTQAICLLNDRDRAGQLYELLTPFQDRHIAAMRGSFSLGSAQYALARLASTKGELDRAARHYEAALELERRWNARAWLVHTRAHYAEVLLNRGGPGDRDLAADLAHEAVAQGHTLDISAAAIPGAVRELAQAALQRP